MDIRLNHHLGLAARRRMGCGLVLAALISLGLGAPGLAQTPSSGTVAGASDEDARARMSDLMSSIHNLETTNDQITTFSDDLSAAKTNQGLVAARQTSLIQTGEDLKTDIHGIADDRKAYEGEVAQHDAQCPQSSTDAGLVARCQAWWARLEVTRKAILARTTDWTARKDKLFAAMKAWDADTAAAARMVQHLQFALEGLKAAKARILVHLGQVNQATLDCRKAIAGASEEEMVERCGQLWDGNAIHPGFVNKGTGSRSFNR